MVVAITHFLPDLKHLSPELVYAIVFAILAVETMGIPAPGEAALVAAALVASQNGKINIYILIACAAVAAIVGDNIGFLLGRKFGRRLFVADGPLKKHRLKLLEKGEPFFERHGPKAVFLGRWVAALRIASAWLAGMNKMKWGPFLFWNALGGICWATTIGVVAYFLGEAAGHFFKTFGYVALGVIVVAILGFLAWRWHRKRKQKA